MLSSAASPTPYPARRRFGMTRLIPSLIATVLLGAAAACQAGEPDASPSPSAEPTANPEVCSETAEGVALSEEGWSVTKTADGEQWVSYAAVFEVDPEVISVDLRVEWFDADGEPLGWGDGSGDAPTYQSLPLMLSNGVGVVSDFAWVVGEIDTIDYTVTRACRTTEDIDSTATIDITDAVLEPGSGDEAELVMDVASGFDEPVDTGLSIVFRDEAGSIIGGTLATDTNIKLSQVAPGDSQYVLTFGWEDFYPDPADIAETTAYPGLPR